MSRPLNGPRTSRHLLATAAAAATALGLTAAVALPSSAAEPAPARPDGAPISVAYVEVNSNELANVGRYDLTDGSPVFDVAIIFAANINHDGTGAYLHLNDQVQATLDDAATQIRPLQERGIKVTLSLLGNHQAAGFANFPTQAAAEAFADEVAEVVRTYGLDGVDIDDEWVDYGNGTTPPANPDSAIWFVDALDEKLPEGSLVTLYDIGETAATLKDAPASTLDTLDYIWNPYYGQFNPPQFPTVPTSRLGAAAIDLNQTSATLAASLASRTVAEGYGVFVTYDLRAGDRSGLVSSFTRELYGQDATYSG